MASVTISPTVEHPTAPAVRRCYDLLTVVPACGITDLTDGKYVDERNDRVGYLAAQERQAEYLLDQVACGPGTRLLDIGCGYGRLLEHAQRRGAQAVGITISPPQVAADRARGLDVRELNYRNIFCCTNPPLASPYVGREEGWDGAFDAIVANGSLEHFVQVADAVAGAADAIYEEMFAICRRLLDEGGRLVTTAIHFREADQFNPVEIARGPRAQQPGSGEVSLCKYSRAVWRLVSGAGSTGAVCATILRANTRGRRHARLLSDERILAAAVLSNAALRPAAVVEDRDPLLAAATRDLGHVTVTHDRPIVGLAISTTSAMRLRRQTWLAK